MPDAAVINSGATNPSGATVFVNNANTNLAAYVRDTIFKNMEQNRQDLEKTWNLCRDNFQAVVRAGEWKKGEATDWRSSTVINATRQKVAAAYAIMIDTLLSGGPIPFMLQPSPWDNLQIDDMPKEQQDAIQHEIAQMTKRIRQQMRDCNADRALMKNVWSLCEYGETWSKNSVIAVVRNGFQLVKEMPAETGITDTTRIPTGLFHYVHTSEQHDSPAWQYVSLWNMYRDMESEDVHDGYGVLQRELVSPYWLRQQKGKYLFLDDVIDEEIKDYKDRIPFNQLGPDNTANTQGLPPVLRDIQYRQKTIQYLEFWGRVPKLQVESLEAWMQETYGGSEKDFELPTLVFDEHSREDDGDEVEVMVCVAGSRIVRFARTTPDMRPFSRCVFEEDLDEQGGRGIAENIKDQQAVLNGVQRAIEDNMKLSANVILGVIEDYLLAPLKDIKPGMKISIDPRCKSVSDAIQNLVIANVTEPLMKMKAETLNALDEESMVPRTLQGIQVDQGKDTAYEIAQRVERAGKYLASVIRNIDESMIEPNVNFFYNYNMNDPYVTKGKGNYIVRAMGFQSYQDRIVRIQHLKELLAIAAQNQNIGAEVNWRKIGQEIIKAFDLEPDQYMLNEVDKAEKTQGDPLPMLAAEKMRAGAAKDQALADKAEAEAKAIAAKTSLEAARTELQRAAEIRKTEVHESDMHQRRMDGAVVPMPNDGQMGADVPQVSDRTQRRAA